MNYAADDFTTIRANQLRIEKERIPTCPQNPSVTLYNCLKSPARCGDNCPHQNDWTGPDVTVS